MLNQASSRSDSTLDSDKKGFLVITLRKAATVPCWRAWRDPFLPKCQLQFLRLIWKLVLGKNRQVSSFPCATEEQENTASMSPGQQESLLVYNSPEFYEGAQVGGLNPGVIFLWHQPIWRMNCRYRVGSPSSGSNVVEIKGVEHRERQSREAERQRGIDWVAEQQIV